jgi:hypothetical protein
VMNWDVARYPAVIGLHSGDELTLTYHTNHDVYQLPDSEASFTDPHVTPVQSILLSCMIC